MDGIINPETSALTGIEWQVSEHLVAYPEALTAMEMRVAAIRGGSAPELIWLLEHPPLYTAGTGARDGDLLDPSLLPIFRTGRGGKFTYHGPGQRVAYVMLDLSKRGNDLRAFVRDLEEWLIRTLARFGLKGERRDGRVGIWLVHADDSEHKIAAIGVRVRRWVSYHGISLNLDLDLDLYRGIVPCGIGEHGVTSLTAEGLTIDMPALDRALRESFDEVFGAPRPLVSQPFNP